MTIHVVGLPHTPFDVDAASACAFTAKTVRFTWMLEALGRDFIVYWGGDSSKHYDQPRYQSIMSTSEQLASFGAYDPAVLPVIDWDINLPYWKEFNQRTIERIRAIIQPGDWIAATGGAIHQPVVDAFPNHLRIEPGVGYGGICQNTFACFESYAWMHDRYGAHYIGNGRAFDAVIPNAVDPMEFVPGESRGYALFVGRLIQRKAPNVAAEIAGRVGLPLKIAGAGALTVEPGKIVATDGTTILGNVEYCGSVNLQARTDLYSHAEVMLVPTLYIGPWEGVHAEALMSDVGVVAPDYGVFTETLPRELRYRTIGEAVRAVATAREMRGSFREDAIKRFSLQKCTEMYDEWFKRLDLLSGEGWYGG